IDLSNTAAPSLIQGNWGNNLAIDGRGQVHAVWTEGGSSASVAYRRSASDGLTWAAMGTFGASSMTFGPRVAASGDNVYITWQGLYEGFTAVYLIRSTNAGATFMPPVRISDPGIAAGNPSIAASGKEVDVVWNDSRTGHPEVYLHRSVDGGATFAPSLQ